MQANGWRITGERVVCRTTIVEAKVYLDCVLASTLFRLGWQPSLSSFSLSLFTSGVDASASALTYLITASHSSGHPTSTRRLRIECAFSQCCTNHGADEEATAMRDGRNRRVALSLFLSLSRSSRLERGPSERLSPVDPASHSANHSASHSTSRFLDVLNLIIKTVAVYRTRISLAFYFKRPREADARRSAVWQFGQKSFAFAKTFSRSLLQSSFSRVTCAW